MADKAIEKTEVDKLREELNSMRAAMSAAAAGRVEETDHYCNECGVRVKNADDACKAHPHSPMNHGGVDALTGKRTLIRVG